MALFFSVCLIVWLFALQRDALACATATAGALWTWTAGTASASWAGEERAATPPWRRRAATARTTTEVGRERVCYTRLCKASKQPAVSWASFSRADCFPTAGGEQAAKSARLTQPERVWKFRWNGFGFGVPGLKREGYLSTNWVHVAEGRQSLCACPVPLCGLAVTRWDHPRPWLFELWPRCLRFSSRLLGRSLLTWDGCFAVTQGLQWLIPMPTSHPIPLAPCFIDYSSICNDVRHVNNSPA